MFMAVLSRMAQASRQQMAPGRGHQAMASSRLSKLDNATPPHGMSLSALACMRKAPVEGQLPTLKAAVKISDMAGLDAVKVRLPRGQRVLDRLLVRTSPMDLSASELPDSSVSKSTSAYAREFVVDNKTGAVHVLSVEVEVPPMQQPVWKVNASDSAVPAPIPTVRGEYYCIEPNSKANRHLITRLRGVDDISLLRAHADQNP